MSNAIVRVHRPELTDEERARRMQEIRLAAERLLVATYRQRKEQNNDIR